MFSYVQGAVKYKSDFLKTLVQNKNTKQIYCFFCIVSLKFYTLLPTCGELLDPFFIKKLEDVSRPNCARTPLLRRRFEIDVRPMPPSGAQTNDNRWGTNLGCRGNVPRFPSGIPSVYPESKRLCEAGDCRGAESHF